MSVPTPNSGRMRLRSGMVSPMVDDTMRHGQVSCITRLDSRLSKSPPIMPHLWATKPAITRMKSTAIWAATDSMFM